MEDWARETRKELREAAATLESLAESMRGEPDSAETRQIWLSYLYVEKAVAFIKLELDEENPGRFVNKKSYSVPDEKQAVVFAAGHLGRGLARFDDGDLKECLKQLREARNYLRMLLRELRLRTRRATSSAPR
jgi:hypothetical protein